MSGILSTSGLPVYSVHSDVASANHRLYAQETLGSSDDEQEAPLNPVISSQDLLNKLVDIECKLQMILALTPGSREQAKANQDQIGFLKQRFNQAKLEMLTKNFQDDPLFLDINEVMDELKARFNPSNLFHKRKAGNESSPVKLVSPHKQPRTKADKLVFSKYVAKTTTPTDETKKTTTPIKGDKGAPSYSTRLKCGQIPLDHFSKKDILRYNRLFWQMNNEELKTLESELPHATSPEQLVEKMARQSCRTELYSRKELIELLNTYQPGCVNEDVSDEELAEMVEVFGIAEQRGEEEPTHYNSSTAITVKKCKVIRESSDDSKELSEDSGKGSDDGIESSSDDKPAFELTYLKIPKQELRRYAYMTSVNSDLFEGSKEDLMKRLSQSPSLTCGILQREGTSSLEGCYELLLKTDTGIDAHFFQVMLGGKIYKFVPETADVTEFANVQLFLNSLQIETILHGVKKIV